MLHTKFHCNRPTGSRVDSFQRVLTIYGHDHHLGYVTHLICTNSHFLAPISFHLKIFFNDPTVSEKKVLILKSE